MKMRKMVSMLCAASVIFMNAGTQVRAENVSDAALNLQDIAALQAAKEPAAELQSSEWKDINMDSATLIKNLTLEKTSRSAGSITQQFTDVLTAEGESKFVEFSLAEGEIFNASLVCPKSANLDYDLVLASVAEDGSINVLQTSELGTYVDPDTGKTVDEGISFIHNQATVGNYAIFVLAAIGSSATDSFTLTISLDAAGSYDSHEANDSPFTAASISSQGTSGSLHVVNDQDWYIVSATSGVYKVTAGNYQAEVYYAASGNRMVRELKAGSNYVLGNKTYFIKVFSNAEDEFTFGDYSLEIADQSKYATMQTAYNFGDWENSYSKLPDVIPSGQQQAYYKFSIDSEDRAYSSNIVFESNKGTLIEYLDHSGNLIDYAFNGSAGVNIPVKGVIKKGSLTYLVVNVDGDMTRSIGYIRVTNVDPLDISRAGSPSIHKRISSGYKTFSFSGTATNPGNGISSVLTLNLTNNSYIPPHAVVDRITTTSSISNVGGVYHQLNPGGQGWLASKTSSATRGSFDFAGFNVEAKVPWQFRYSQTAFASTQMRSVEMTIYWDYDMQYTNYELFK